MLPSQPEMKRHAILVPAHNSAATIGETLQSLLRQDLSAIGAIYLADDASTDATVAIARTVWQSTIPLIVLTQERNLGQWKNVNAAMRQIPDQAGWVHILHSDD